jgi:endo-1,4-beta-xylanase
MHRRNSQLIAVLLTVLALLQFSLAQSLREEADHRGILIGTATRAYLLSEAPYTSTLAHEYNLLERENDLKWQAIHPAEHTFNFLPGDQLVEFARLHGMKVRGHCLVWSQYVPDWLAQGHYTSAQLRQLLHEHITTVVSHFKGKVFAWDVVNEAVDEKGQFRSSIWYDQPGIGEAGRGAAYIEQAFRWAHEADPAALLFYNEAEGEAMSAKSNAVYAMLQDFKKRGVPVGGVGLQMHILNLNPDIDGMAANIRRLTALGLQVHITELDVALPIDAEGRPRDPADLQRQADIYRRIALACVSQPGCTAIQTWGFTDKYSWIRNWTKGAKGQALPFDRDYQPKPAYRALREALHEAPARSEASQQ